MASRVFVRNNEAIIVPSDALEIPDPSSDFRDRYPLTMDYSIPLQVQTADPNLPPHQHHNGPPPQLNAHGGHHPGGHYVPPPVVQGCGMMHHPPATMAYLDGPLFMLRVVPPDTPILSLESMVDGNPAHIVEHPDCTHDPPCRPHTVHNNIWLPTQDPDEMHFLSQAEFRPLVTEDEIQRIFRKMVSRLERLRQENYELRMELHSTRMYRAH